MGAEVIKPDDTLQGKCVDRGDVFILSMYSMPGSVLHIGGNSYEIEETKCLALTELTSQTGGGGVHSDNKHDKRVTYIAIFRTK